MQTKYLIPQSGLTVPFEVGGKHLPPEGKDVPWTPYWARRVKEGAVKIGKAPAKTKAKE